MTATAASPLSPAWRAVPDADVSDLSNSTRRDWTRRDAAHLVRRSRLGASCGDIDQALSAGPAAAIELLLAEQKESQEFLLRDAALHTVAHNSGNIADLRRGGPIACSIRPIRSWKR